MKEKNPCGMTSQAFQGERILERAWELVEKRPCEEWIDQKDRQGVRDVGSNIKCHPIRTSRWRDLGLCKEKTLNKNGTGSLTVSGRGIYGGAILKLWAEDHTAKTWQWMTRPWEVGGILKVPLTLGFQACVSCCWNDLGELLKIVQWVIDRTLPFSF